MATSLRTKRRIFDWNRIILSMLNKASNFDHKYDISFSRTQYNDCFNHLDWSLLMKYYVCSEIITTIQQSQFLCCTIQSWNTCFTKCHIRRDIPRLTIVKHKNQECCVYFSIIIYSIHGMINYILTTSPVNYLNVTTLFIYSFTYKNIRDTTTQRINFSKSSKCWNILEFAWKYFQSFTYLVCIQPLSFHNQYHIGIFLTHAQGREIIRQLIEVLNFAQFWGSDVTSLVVLMAATVAAHLKRYVVQAVDYFEDLYIRRLSTHSVLA